MFEHFGGLKSAIHAARDGRHADAEVEVEGADKRAAADPEYTIPTVREREVSTLAASTWQVLDLKEQNETCHSGANNRDAANREYTIPTVRQTSLAELTDSVKNFINSRKLPSADSEWIDIILSRR